MRLWDWFLKRRARTPKGVAAVPLREFVYLDEVSVNSLLASLVGMLDDKATFGKTRSTSVSAATKMKKELLIASGELGTNFSTSYGGSEQIVRKAVVQSSFRQLHGELQGRIVNLRRRQKTPALPTRKELESFLRTPDGYWVVDLEKLERGAVVEIEVVLDVEAVFQLSAVFSSLLEVFDGKHEALQVHELGDLTLYNDILGRLISGLVPVRALCIDYVALVSEGQDRFVRREVVPLFEAPFPKIYDVDLVGVAEKALFWKDVRRILFSRSSYTVLARVRRSGLQRSWVPFKSVESLANLIPQMAEALEQLNDVAKKVACADPSGALASSTRVEALPPEMSLVAQYANELARFAEIEHTEDELAQLIQSSSVAKLGKEEYSVEVVRLLCEPVEAWAQKRKPSLSREDIARIREGVFFSSSRPLVIDTRRQQASKPANDDRLLDVEIIAIYW